MYTKQITIPANSKNQINFSPSKKKLHLGIFMERIPEKFENTSFAYSEK